jgi:hypothetical protein
MKIRIIKKTLPKAELGVPYVGSNAFKKNMNRIQGTFNPSAPSLNVSGYSPQGLSPISQVIPQPSFSFNPQPGMDKILGTFKPNNDIFQSYKPMGLNPNFPIPQKKTTNKNSLSGVNDGTFLFNLGLTGANMLVDAIGDKKRQREFNRMFRNTLLNPTPTPPMSGSRGDYTVNEGFFRPDEMQPPNKGMFSNQFYSPITMSEGGNVIPEQLNVPFQYVTEFQNPMVDAAMLDKNVAAPLPPKKESSSAATGVNPMAESTWTDISSTFPGTTNMGIWGDSSHKKRKSDHNTGDALDIGITDLKQGELVASKLIKEAQDRGIKYIIWNNKIWNPSVAPDWRDYNGSNPHTSHIHVSFNRGNTTTGNQEGGLAVRNNNPGNIHYGDYVRKWNATKGDPDAGGHVATFNSIDDGLEAMNELLFGSKYNNLTVSQARNKWVSGNPAIGNPSTSNIVKKIGKDVPLNQLSEQERKLLLSEFIKWEDRTMYDKLKKQNYFEQGGEFEPSIENTNMKIRIKGMPNMAYGGQMGYGLDLNNRKVYTDMPEQMTDMVSNSMTEYDNPEEPYVLEAEGGETILRPDGTHFNINGKRHTSGGEKLTGSQAPEGSFIYSDTAKMRIGGPVLKMFGKGEKKKYTPAELAKQYDVNKYKAILDNKYADPLQKQTAKQMIENYQKKLGALALLQESKKNFKDGIPQVAMPYLESMMNAMPQEEESEQELPTAKFGGYLREYQQGTEVKKEFDLNGQKVSAKKVSKTDLNSQWKEVGKFGNTTLYKKDGSTATVSVPSSSTYTPGATVGRGQGNNPLKYTVEDMKQRPGLYRTVLSKEGWDKASPQEQQAYLNRLKITGQRSTFVPGAVTESKIQTNPRYAFIDQDAPQPPSSTQQTIPPIEQDNPPQQNQGPTPGNPNAPYGGGEYGSGWMTPDKMNLLASLAIGPKKYLPYIPAMNVRVPEPTFEDWRAKAAARQAMYNTAAQTLGAYGPTQGLASNLAFMAGQQGDALIQDIAGTETRNVGIANQFSGIQADMMNKLAEYEAKRKQALYDGNVIANQQYRNAWRDYLNKGAKAYTQGWKNKSMLGMLNATNRNYGVNPRTGNMFFKPGADLFNVQGSQSQSNGQLTPQAYLDYMKDLKERNPTMNDTQIAAAAKIYANSFKAGTTGTDGGISNFLQLIGMSGMQ